MKSNADYSLLSSHLLFAGHELEISELLTTCYVNNKYLDIIFICKDNVCVQVHKVILISVSEYLKRIIHNSPGEMIFISLPDFESTIVEILVHFLYEGITRVNLQELSCLKELIKFLEIRLENCDIKEYRQVLVSSETITDVENNLKNVKNSATLGTKNSVVDLQQKSQDLPVLEGLAASLSNFHEPLIVESEINLSEENIKLENHNISGTEMMSYGAVRSDTSQKYNSLHVETGLHLEIINQNQDFETNAQKIPFALIQKECQDNMNFSSLHGTTENTKIVLDTLKKVAEKYSFRNNMKRGFTSSGIQENEVPQNLRTHNICDESGTYNNRRNYVSEDAYRHDIYPSEGVRTKVAKKLGISIQKVNEWFKNKHKGNKTGIRNIAAPQQQHISTHISAKPTSSESTSTVQNWNNTCCESYINSTSEGEPSNVTEDHVQEISEERLADSTNFCFLNAEQPALHSGQNKQTPNYSLKKTNDIPLPETFSNQQSDNSWHSVSGNMIHENPLQIASSNLQHNGNQLSCESLQYAQYDRDKRSSVINSSLSKAPGQSKECFTQTEYCSSVSERSRISVLDVYEKFIENCLNVNNTEKSSTVQNCNEPDSQSIQISGTPLSLAVPIVNNHQSKLITNANYNKTKWYTCKACNKKFVTLPNLKAHICHLNTKYKCRFCDVTFHSRTITLEHEHMIHQARKPY